MKESGHQASIGQKQADKTTQLQTDATLSRKRKMGRQGGRAGNLMGVWLVGFQSCLGLVTLFFFCSLPFLLYIYLAALGLCCGKQYLSFQCADFLVAPPGLSCCGNSLPFGMGTSIAIILYLSHNGILGADNLFSSFRSPEMERNSAPGWIIPSATDFR